MSVFHVTVPLDGIRPVPWSKAYRNEWRAGRVLSVDGRAYKRHVAEWVALAWNRLAPAEQEHLRSVTRLALDIDFALLPPLPDLDNLNKLPQDSLMQIVGRDDGLICDLHLHRREVRRDPALHITLSVMEETS